MARKIEIEMPPFGKARPRVTRGGQHTYMPVEYQNKRDLLRGLYRAAGGEVDVEGPVFLDIRFYFRMPKSWSKKKKDNMAHEYCQKTPDLDNLVGAVMDALIEKDQKVVRIWSAKFWGLEDKIVIRMEDAI